MRTWRVCLTSKVVQIDDTYLTQQHVTAIEPMVLQYYFSQ